MAKARNNSARELMIKRMDSKRVLKLFVTSRTPLSERAELNLRQICDEELGGNAELEIIDVVAHPELAAAQQIVATPTLIVIEPNVTRRLIGDFSDRSRVRRGLGLLDENAAR